MTESTIAASEKNAMWKCPNMKVSAYVGESALRISGSSAMPLTPQAPMDTNHRIITGPKKRPTVAVPRRCTANSATMITAVIGTIQSSIPGSTVLRPSTEDSTEIAGVIMLSPKNSDAPKMPSVASIKAVRRRPPATFHRRNIVMSAMMPPSPSLSARITSVM